MKHLLAKIFRKALSAIPKEVAFVLIGALIAVPLATIAATAQSYPSTTLTHLVDKTNADTTSTTVNVNDPSWRVGIPLSTPIARTVATSTGGTIASSTTEYFGVAALDYANGTTTISNTIHGVTLAPGNPGEVMQVTWSPVTGATGYALYFGTSATNLTSCFTATSTAGVANNYYTFATSTGAYSCANTLTDQTAYSVRFEPGNTSYFEGGGLVVNGAVTANSLTVNGFSQGIIATTTTSTIGGSQLATSTCATGNATFATATVSSTTVEVATPQTYEGDGFAITAFAANPTTVTVRVCAEGLLTPISTKYNIRVIP